ncbi:hypothetical protein AYO45_05595 [Gammaproteobacteria bacterium SCGC AG-212-F23]|nr:hypothetical protein AYO45_05595 [Gammaproteobacteria bacterium SCGC AG-212-F23]
MENVITDDLLIQNTLVQKLGRMIKTMFAIEPVIINVIAVGLGLGVLCLLHFPVLFPQLGKYYSYLTYAIYGLIAIQTIRSATKSLFIPTVAFIIVCGGYAALHIDPQLSFISIDLLKKLTLLGVVGVATAILAMK